MWNSSYFICFLIRLSFPIRQINQAYKIAQKDFYFNSGLLICQDGARSERSAEKDKSCGSDLRGMCTSCCTSGKNCSASLVLFGNFLIRLHPSFTLHFRAVLASFLPTCISIISVSVNRQQGIPTFGSFSVSSNFLFLFRAHHIEHLIFAP